MHNYKYKELKLQPHGSGQDKNSVTFGKVHDMIILKIQASYENEIDIKISIWASKILDINGVAPERNFYEETYVKKE